MGGYSTSTSVASEDQKARRELEEIYQKQQRINERLLPAEATPALPPPSVFREIEALENGLQSVRKRADILWHQLEVILHPQVPAPGHDATNNTVSPMDHRSPLVRRIADLIGIAQETDQLLADISSRLQF